MTTQKFTYGSPEARMLLDYALFKEGTTSLFQPLPDGSYLEIHRSATGNVWYTDSGPGNLPPAHQHFNTLFQAVVRGELDSDDEFNVAQWLGTFHELLLSSGFAVEEARPDLATYLSEYCEYVEVQTRSNGYWIHFVDLADDVKLTIEFRTDKDRVSTYKGTCW